MIVNAEPFSSGTRACEYPSPCASPYRYIHAFRAEAQSRGPVVVKRLLCPPITWLQHKAVAARRDLGAAWCGCRVEWDGQR